MKAKLTWRFHKELLKSTEYTEVQTITIERTQGGLEYLVINQGTSVEFDVPVNEVERLEIVR